MIHKSLSYELPVIQIGSLNERKSFSRYFRLEQCCYLNNQCLDIDCMPRSSPVHACGRCISQSLKKLYSIMLSTFPGAGGSFHRQPSLTDAHPRPVTVSPAEIPSYAVESSRSGQQILSLDLTVFCTYFFVIFTVSQVAKGLSSPPPIHRD